jgi:uncharacterized protein (DUF433 family)
MIRRFDPSSAAIRERRSAASPHGALRPLLAKLAGAGYLGGGKDVVESGGIRVLERTVKFTRITTDPRLMGGLPCIRGLRIPVATVVAMIADGMSEAEILSAYPDLERDDVREALRYAADAVRERELPLILP